MFGNSGAQDFGPNGDSISEETPIGKTTWIDPARKLRRFGD